MNAVNKQTISTEIAGERLRIGQNLLERIGNTPLLRLERMGADFPERQVLCEG